MHLTPIIQAATMATLHLDIIMGEIGIKVAAIIIGTNLPIDPET